MLVLSGSLLVPVPLVMAETEPAEAPVATNTIERARVIEILTDTTRKIPGTDTDTTYQSLKAELIDGPNVGTVVMVENDYLNLDVGDEFYANHYSEPASGVDTYSVQEPYRLPVVVGIGILFLLTVILFGGKQGLRGLVALVVSLGAIMYILLPGILAGYSPVLMSVGISSFIVIVGSYVTHGVNRTTTAAVFGMIVTICLTGALAYWSVYMAHLSGYSGEEATYLHFSTQGSIDFIGLLLGGIMIGLLGILYDAAIGQAIAVEELKSVGTHLSSGEIYRRAIRIGREHIGALVNTLAIAYVGASLPLLLLLHFTNMSLAATINQEIFSSEIIRTAVGSIGLVLTVPITTLISIWMLREDGASHGHSHTH